MSTNPSKTSFPQWPVKTNSFFDKFASWIDKFFFCSANYSLSTEKIMIVALFTNILGLHKVYCGRKISAIIGWLLLVCSFADRECLWLFLIPWLIVDLVRIYFGNYGRLKSKKHLNFTEFKNVLFSNIKSSAIMGIASIIIIILVCLIGIPSNPMQKSNNNVVSSSDASGISNVLLEADFKVGDVMNGFGTEKLGEYAYIEITKEQLKKVTNDEYAQFVNTKVTDSGYNWVAIICDDGTGICFEGSIGIFATYGKQDKDGTITEVYGYINYSDGKYCYEEAELNN